jgi:hypothetical protein
MKHTLTIFILALAAMCMQAQSHTTNCNLFLPPHGYTPWDTAMNSDLSLVDDCFGVALNPFQGVWSSAAVYKKYQQVSYNSSLYISLQNSNQNNTPSTAPTWWALYLPGSGYTLPIATTSVLGGVKPDGTSCTVNSTTGVLSCAGSAVNSGTAGQIAYYPSNGAAVSGQTSVPIAAGGTGATTAAGAMSELLGPTSQLPSFVCGGTHDGTDLATARAWLSTMATVAPNGTTLYAPQNCYFKVTSPTDTEALLFTTPVSIQGNHATWQFELPTSTLNITGCSETSGGVVTAQATNSLVAGISGRIGNVFTGPCTFLNNTPFTVIASGLSGTQFEFNFQGAASAQTGGSDTGAVTIGTNYVRIAPQVSPAGFWPSGFYAYNTKIQDITFQAAVNGVPGVGGQNALKLDCTSNDIGQININNVKFEASNGYSVDIENPRTGNNGCIAVASITANTLLGGLWLNGVGDTLNVSNNQIDSDYGQDGIFVCSEIGAVANIFADNNVITSGNPFHVQCGSKMTVRGGEYGINRYVLPTAATSTFWLDGSSGPDKVEDITLENIHIGTDENNLVPKSLLQIDNNVDRVKIYPNVWAPQVVSGVAYPAILNNGGATELYSGQEYPYYPNVAMLDPASHGTWLKNDLLSGTLGIPLVGNRLLWSDQVCNSAGQYNFPWTTSISGAGIAATCSLVSTILPNKQTGIATQLNLSVGSGTLSSDYSGVMQSITGLSNPHGTALQVCLASADAGTYTVDLFSGAASGAITVSPLDANGNGWTCPQLTGPSVNASTGDYFQIGVSGTSLYSHTANIIMWRAINSDVVGQSTGTTDTAIPTQRAVMPNNFVPGIPVTSPSGFLDSSTAAPGGCTATNVGAYRINKSEVPNTVENCIQVMSSPITYQWQITPDVVDNPANNLLYSATLTNVAWSLGYTGTGSNPTVTPQPSATDNFGATGGVTEILFAPGSTSGSNSSIYQIISGLANPHTGGIQSMWVKSAPSASNTTGLMLYNYNNPSIYTIFNTTSSWQKITFSPGSIASTSDNWRLTAEHDYVSGSADIYVSGICMTNGVGSCGINPISASTTTSSAITYVPLPSKIDGYGDTFVTASSGIISQSTSSTAAGLSGTPALPTGSTLVASPSAADNTLKIPTTAWTNAAITSAGFPTLPLSQANGGFGAAVTEANCLAGLLPMPCRAGHIAPTTYSGTVSQSATIGTSVPAGQYTLCGSVVQTVSPSAVTTVGLTTSFTSGGHLISSTMLGGSSTGTVAASFSVTTQWTYAQSCEVITADASTNIGSTLYLNGVTGSPSYLYSFSLMRMQ